MGCFGDLKSRQSHFFATIVLLDGSQLVHEVQNSSRGQQLLDLVFKHLDILESAYFGLRFVDSSDQTRWLDSRKKVMKQMKGCKDYNLYFGVKFYAVDPCKLVEEITRYQFFLQLKQDILNSRLPVTFDVASELLAFVAQSELGDYDPELHGHGYLSDFKLLPKQSRDIEERAELLHRGLIGRVPAAAELLFLDRVKWLDLYGADLHPVLGEDSCEYFIALTPSGVLVLRNKAKVASYLWTRISKVQKKGKYFMLRVTEKNGEEKTYGFELPRIEATDHLWSTCLDHQDFFGKSGMSRSNLSHSNVTRPAPTVVRVPSIRRPQKENNAIQANALNNAASQFQMTVTNNLQSRSWDELSTTRRRRSGRSSDGESEVSRHSRHSSCSRHRRCRHSKSGHESGSESESGTARRRRRRRSCHRSSHGTLIDSEQFLRQNNHQEPSTAVVREVPSLVYPVATARRRQLIPSQIKQFLEFDLVDPPEKESIPYTQIESESQLRVRYSPTSGKAKCKQTSAAKEAANNERNNIYANLMDNLDQYPGSVTDNSLKNDEDTVGSIGQRSAGSRAPVYDSGLDMALKSREEMATEL